MEVPDTVLENLKCDNCDNYLSRGPVLVLDNKRSRCGRCRTSEQGAKRYKPYEDLAQLMKFPCRYKENGCEEKIRFEENKAHEEACVYKTYCCPMDKCNWTNKPGVLLEGHFKSYHQTNVIRNSHDIKQGENYLLLAFDSIFLVLTKVCPETKKIYCCVRLIGESELASKYTFDIDVVNGNNQLKTCGKVASEGCLMLEEDICVVLDINGLVMMLGEIEDTKCSLTVRSTDGEVKKKQVKCMDCPFMTEPVYHNTKKGYWLCRFCAPVRRPCKYYEKGCKFTDYDKKCEMHEFYFCPYNTFCKLCATTITEICLDEHYEQNHDTYEPIESEVHYKKKLNNEKWFIIRCNFGNVICHYIKGKLFLNVPLPSAQLYMYQWEIQYKVSNAKYSEELTANYDWWNDWSVTIFDEQSEWYNNNCTLKIKFKKEKNP